jgi:hypothetical protein
MLFLAAWFRLAIMPVLPGRRWAPTYLHKTVPPLACAKPIRPGRLLPSRGA